MAQNGDSSNILRPPFRRQASEGRPSNPASPPVPDAKPSETNWMVRRRNQWRQQQQLSMPQQRPPEQMTTPQSPPAGATPPRSRSLHLPQPGQPSPRRPGQPQRPAPDRRPDQRPEPTATSRPRPQRPPEPRLKYPVRGARTAARSGQTSPETPPNKVTPLPMKRSQGTPPRQSDKPRSHDRNRRKGDTPRRPAKQPPLPVLYGIRLLILGVGIAAIAGTLLSVLSPTDLPASDQTPAPSIAETNSSQRQSQTWTGSTIQAVPLGQELEDLKLELDQLTTYIPGFEQTVFVLNLDSGEYVDLNGNMPVAAASTIKVPILVSFLQAVDRGEVSLDQSLVLRESQLAGGSGSLQYEPPGSQYTALDVATEMIINSDNTATNMIIDLVGGQAVLNQQFQSWGLTATVLRNPLPDLEGTNTTSTRDLALLMALIDRGELMSLRSRDRLFSIMQHTRSRRLIPDSVSDNAITANKTGDIKSALGDVALVDTLNGTRYVLSILVQRPDNDSRAGELIRRAAGLIDDTLNQPLLPTETIEMDATPPADETPNSASPLEDMSIEEMPVEQPRPGSGSLPQG